MEDSTPKQSSEVKILGPEYLKANKSYMLCSYGITPATMQAAQGVVGDKNGNLLLTTNALSTTMKGDFLCTYSVLLTALIGALIAATGGAGAIALAAVIVGAVAGGGIAMAVGTLLCGFFGSMFRMWILPKTNVLIKGTIPQNPVLSYSSMCCNIFGGTITYLPKVKTWWQALLVATSNFLTLGVFRCIMVGAAVYTFVALAAVAAATLGARYIGGAFFKNVANWFLNSAGVRVGGYLSKNVLANWALSFTKAGMLLRGGVAVNNVIQDRYVREGDKPLEQSVGEGLQFYERGAEDAGKALIKGQLTVEQALGLVALATPIETAPAEQSKPVNQLQEETNGSKESETGKNDTDNISKEEGTELSKRSTEKGSKEEKEQLAEENRNPNGNNTRSSTDTFPYGEEGLYEGDLTPIEDVTPVDNEQPPSSVSEDPDVQEHSADSLPPIDYEALPPHIQALLKPPSLIIYFIKNNAGIPRHAALIAYSLNKGTAKLYDLLYKQNASRRVVVDQNKRIPNTIRTSIKSFIRSFSRYTIKALEKREYYEIPITEKQYDKLLAEGGRISSEIDGSIHGRGINEHNCVTLVAELLRAMGFDVPQSIGRTNIVRTVGPRGTAVPPLRDWVVQNGGKLVTNLGELLYNLERAIRR